jgi:excisionase family DNA binding protein
MGELAKGDRFLTPDEVATILGIDSQTLANWRSTKRYPLKYARIGRRIRYRLSDVEAFAESRMVTPTGA